MQAEENLQNTWQADYVFYQGTLTYVVLSLLKSLCLSNFHYYSSLGTSETDTINSVQHEYKVKGADDQTDTFSHLFCEKQNVFLICPLRPFLLILKTGIQPVPTMITE